MTKNTNFVPLSRSRRPILRLCHNAALVPIYVLNATPVEISEIPGSGPQKFAVQTRLACSAIDLQALPSKKLRTKSQALNLNTFSCWRSTCSSVIHLANRVTEYAYFHSERSPSHNNSKARAELSLKEVGTCRKINSQVTLIRYIIYYLY